MLGDIVELSVVVRDLDAAVPDCRDETPSDGRRDALERDARRLPDRWSLPPAGSTRRVRSGTGGSRLVKGEVAGMVLAHLRGNREAGLTPTAVAKALGGKSAGAVGNALERLVAAGDIVKVAEHPRTYQARSAKPGKK